MTSKPQILKDLENAHDEAFQEVLDPKSEKDLIREKLIELSKEECHEGLINLVGKTISRMAAKKNHSYNNSYNRTVEQIRNYFPDGIKPDQYHILPIIIRQWDKIQRSIKNPTAFGENPHVDRVGYSILDAVAEIVRRLDQGAENLGIEDIIKLEDFN